MTLVGQSARQCGDSQPDGDKVCHCLSVDVYLGRPENETAPLCDPAEATGNVAGQRRLETLALHSLCHTKSSGSDSREAIQLHLVREVKGALDDDHFQRMEEMTINRARCHFDAIAVRYDVVRSAEDRQRHVGDR